MDHDERCRRDEFNLIIPVADGVQAVPSQLVETQLDSQGFAIDRKPVSGQRT